MHQHGTEMQGYRNDHHAAQQSPSRYQQPSAPHENPPPTYQQLTANPQQPQEDQGAQVQPNPPTGYRIPKLKTPGIMMIMIGVLMTLGFTRLGSVSLIIPAEMYLVIGSICLLVYHEDRGRGLVTLLLALTIMAFVVAIDAEIQLISIANRTDGVRDLELINGIAIFLVLINVVAAILLFVLVIFTSRTLCICCEVLSPSD